MSTTEHRQNAKDVHAKCAILTISDTRTLDTDTSGHLIAELLESAGHHITDRALVRDEVAQIGSTLTQWIEDDDVQVILTTGGTGIARRDTTIEVVKRMIDKPLPGFGELFRVLSYQQVKSAAMLSRAIAGLAGNTMIFTMPGSQNAVKLAMEKLIVPELSHLVWERHR
ncbi:MAG TPA: molybdenum cofactor biosynthesis protein [Phycisphaerales bacterium]|nr:molybdenum cofactor biosynthesis protein [Phycisphaerales bacterium]HCD32909.1 molybdenum cofactor biosynthesis protein [Phycisphaerales bacterium]|tara:strand:- start:310 stop:816 length:507 start_codon:yes stop_codon:yes gene_type:complete